MILIMTSSSHLQNGTQARGELCNSSVPTLQYCFIKGMKLKELHVRLNENYLVHIRVP